MDRNESDRILSNVMDLLENERNRQGLSLRETGAVSGIDRTTIWKAETGKRSPSLTLCLRMADALGLDLEDVIKSARKRRKRRAD
jgi:putative molybdopterin biosynthesis protein